MSTARTKPRIAAVATNDGLVNMVTRLGSGGDKAMGATYMFAPEVSALEIDAAYATTWLRKIVDIPPNDEIREWRSWNGADEKQITAIEDEERRLDIRRKIREARILARKDGASVILLGVTGNAAEPIDPNRVGKLGLEYVTVLNRNEINPGERETDPVLPGFGEPRVWKLRGDQSGEIEIHPTRVIKFIGNPARQYMGGWDGWNGQSIWGELRAAITDADRIERAIASMIEEASLDVIKVKNLMANLLTADGEDKLVRRFGSINQLKSIINALIIDAEDDYDKKQVSFAGLTDIQNGALMVMAGMADIPATRLLGRSPQGLNSTGESDLRNYYDRIRAGQTIDLGPTIAPLDELLIRSALGSRPPEIFYEWKPLYQMDDKQAAEIEKQFADAANVYAQAGLLPDDALTEIVKGGIIERGQWPGAEKALDEATMDPELTREPTPEEIAAEEARLAAMNNPGLAADAAPRSLYVRRDLVNKSAIIAWAKSQGFATTLDDLHVTITYSRQPVDWMKMGDNWSSDQNGNLVVSAGGPRMMDKFGEATVLLFSSSTLSWRHEDMVHNGASWDHDEYQPHVTISYEFDGDLDEVEPYRGELVFGPEIFEDINDDYREGITEK